MFVLEVAARPIGGLCSQALRFADGSSLEHVLLRHAIGEDVSASTARGRGGGGHDDSDPEAGNVEERRRREAAARAVPHVEDVRITAKPGQLLEPLPEAGSYLGFIFARAGSTADADAAVRGAHAQLSFTIEPAIDVVDRWQLSSGLLRLLRDEAGRQRRALAEEEILHLLGDDLLGLFLPGHQAVLVENHLHPLFPELPRFGGDVLVDALAQLARPGLASRPGISFWNFWQKTLRPVRLFAGGSGDVGPPQVPHGEMIALRAKPLAGPAFPGAHV